jgi:hypothetical protein
VLQGAVYRLDMCRRGVDDGKQLSDSPKGARFARFPLKERTTLFVSPTDRLALLKRDQVNAKFARVSAE